jgi:hypothetical protein
MAQPFLALITPLSSGPVDPGYNPPGVGPGQPGGPPLGTWGGVAPPYPDIGLPGPQPPSGAHPSHPIWRPDLGIWGGPWQPPYPSQGPGFPASAGHLGTNRPSSDQSDLRPSRPFTGCAWRSPRASDRAAAGPATGDRGRRQDHVEGRLDTANRVDCRGHPRGRHPGADAVYWAVADKGEALMLYDPKWTRNPDMLVDLRAWLATQPSDQAYVFSDGETCLMAQYLQATGQPEDTRMQSWYLPVAMPAPHTFGDALKRAAMLG